MCVCSMYLVVYSSHSIIICFAAAASLPVVVIIIRGIGQQTLAAAPAVGKARDAGERLRRMARESVADTVNCE